MKDVEYIHTFTKVEQDRLVLQAELLGPHLHQHLSFSGRTRLLEIGCGVGAQLRVLSRKYPELQMTGVDISAAQIERARMVLSQELAAGRIDLHTAQGHELPFADRTFDAVYICFVLEHATDPVAVLREAKRVLVDGGVLYCTEVFNDGMYVFPKSPAIMKYWQAFNECQIQIGGHPNIGIHLAEVMLDAGLIVDWLKDLSYMVDRRMTDPNERTRYFDHWYANFMSAKPRLLSEGAIDPGLVQEFDREYDALRGFRDAVFLYSNKQVCARKPSVV